MESSYILDFGEHLVNKWYDGIVSTNIFPMLEIPEMHVNKTKVQFQTMLSFRSEEDIFEKLVIKSMILINVFESIN